MFSEDPLEQELYHAIATVASLLLRIGEVGKKFSNQPTKAGVRKTPLPRDLPSDEEEQTSPSEHSQEADAVVRVTSNRDFPQVEDSKAQEENQKSDEGAGSEEGTGSPPQLLSDDDTRDDLSMSSYSMVSAGSLHCEDIADDTVLVGCDTSGSGPKYGSTIDADWSISFEQILASILTEAPLVDYFEKKVDIRQKIKQQKKMERQVSSSSDYEKSSVSG
ncbi:TBC1 domain family member 9B-like [Ambystoma mexicanum]|uniref:TBC1 domain family member 9B-like n=1 Tax=Ambystoma mexicanum TaxID=8296 RepID=UPI0037E7B046